MKHLQTLEQKRAFLKKLQQGRVSIKSLLQPITAVKFVYEEKVYIEQIKDGNKRRVENVSAFESKESVTHVVVFNDYSINNIL